MTKIIWLASFPKSGNTWTRIFLMNLFMNPSEPLPINEVYQMSPSDVALEWYRMVDPRPPESWTVADYAQMRPRVQEKIASHAPDSIFVKTHSPLSPWHGVPAFNMQVTAGAICIVRNPLDVVASYASHSGLDLDPMIEIMQRPDYAAPGGEERAPHPIGSWSQNVASWTARGHQAMHVMRYEDMVANPVKAFSGLVKYLQIDAPRSRIERAVKNSSFKVLRHQEELHGFAEKTIAQKNFFRSGKCGEWKDVLSEEQVAAICNNHRDQMTRFGYLPEGY